MCNIFTNIFGSSCHWPSQLSHKLLGIQSYFNDVVEQSKERSQREGGHKQSNETKLDDWTHRGTQMSRFKSSPDWSMC